MQDRVKKSMKKRFFFTNYKFDMVSITGTFTLHKNYDGIMIPSHRKQINK